MKRPIAMSTSLQQLFEFPHWIGDVILPMATIGILAWRARERCRPPGVVGALFAAAAFVILLTCAAIHTKLFWHHTPGAFLDFDPATLVIIGSAIPTAIPFNVLFEKHRFVEENFLLSFALASWLLAGAVIGILVSRIRKHFGHG